MSDKTDAELIADNRKDAGAWLEGRRAIDCSNPQGRLILYSTELANRLEARNAEVAELKRLLKWAWDNAIGRLESVETDEGLTVRSIRFPNRLERDAIEKIVGEK